MFLIVLPDVAEDDSLLWRVRLGDKDAIILTYERYFPAIYQYIRLKVGDRAAAQDIVSEVFVKLIECAGMPCAPRENLRAWLFAVARHAAYRVIGQPTQLPLEDVEEWMSAPSDTNPDVLIDALRPRTTARRKRKRVEVVEDD